MENKQELLAEYAKKRPDVHLDALSKGSKTKIARSEKRKALRKNKKKTLAAERKKSHEKWLKLQEASKEIEKFKTSQAKSETPVEKQLDIPKPVKVVENV